MSRRASPTLIGLFIVGAIILAVSATLLLSSGLLRDKSRFVMFFNGSVKGLNVGAPVNFRGVKIGTVTDIRLLLDPDTQRVYIPVYVELDPERISLISGEAMTAHKMSQMSDMITHGLRAQLQMQSLLTGQLAIQLDIYPDTPANLVGTDKEIIEIPTTPTPSLEFTRKVEEFPIDVLLNNIASAAAGIDKLFNGPELPQAIKQFDQTMQDYSVLSGEYSDLAHNLDQRSDALSTDLNITLKEMRTTLQLTQGLIGSGETLMNNSNDLVKQLRINADRLTVSADETLNAIKATSDSATQLIAEESPFQHQLTKTLEEVASSARALRILADTLEQNPETLIRGKPDEDKK
jgi:paraquat-inducible protein B